MKRDRLGMAATIVWTVVGLLFSTILASHIKNQSFRYQHVVVESVEPIPSVMYGVAKPPSNGLSIGSNGIYVNGKSLEKPLQDFINKFNSHIDDLNKVKLDEGFLLIVLDIVGAVTSFFSAGYEFVKSRKNASASSAAMITAPVTATAPGAPPKRKANSEVSMTPPPAIRSQMAISGLPALRSYIGLVGLLGLAGFLATRDSSNPVNCPPLERERRRR